MFFHSFGGFLGSGLFLGLEPGRDRKSLEPAAAGASYVVDPGRELGVLAGTDGPLRNVIKIRPFLRFSETGADLFLSAPNEVLAEDPARIT